MRHAIDAAWSLDLPDDGTGSPNDAGDLIVTSRLGTIVVSCFHAHDAFDPQLALDELKASERPDPRAEFDEYGPDGTLRWASLVDEPDEDDHQVALFGFVIASDSWVQVAVLYDDPHDHDQALSIWRSIRHAK